MLVYLNPDFKSGNKQFKRIDFSTNKMGTNHFPLFSSILRVHHNTKWVGNGLKLNWGKF